MIRKLVQYDPPHPGEILKEFYLQPLELSISECAEKLGWSIDKLRSVLYSQSKISKEMASDLAKVFNTSSGYWLNIQASFDLWKANKKT